MGPSVSGLDSLLKMPTGCGEQTMLGLAPDVYITDYLTAVNQLTGEIEDKALGYMEKGRCSQCYIICIFLVIIYYIS